MNQTAKPFVFLDAYKPLFKDYIYYLISGGRGGGKTTNVIGYILMKLLTSSYCRCAISRYTQTALTKSLYQELLDAIKSMGMESYFIIKGNTVMCKFNDNKIVSHSMKLADGSMDSQGKGLAGITHLIIDEATEIKYEREFVKLADTIRGNGDELKIFIMFNPTVKSHWLHKRFYIDGKPNPKWKDYGYSFIHTTFRDNTFLNPIKAKEYADKEFLSPYEYRYDIQGDWNDQVEGRIFDNWEVSDEPQPEEYGITYGLDFGYSNDPASLVRVIKHNKTLWVKELIYLKGLTNEDLSNKMIELGISKKDLIIADSAEPKSIEQLKRLGWNIKGASKGPDSIRIGINKIQEHNVIVDRDSVNLINEYQNYAWYKDTGKPIDNFNHAMDAFRYALSNDKPTIKKFAISGIR